MTVQGMPERGGEEFVEWLRRYPLRTTAGEAELRESACPSRAWARGKRLLAAVQRHTATIVGQPVTTTVSLGIALFPQHGVTAEEILANADRALYRAKTEGRNTYRVYSPEMNQSSGA